MSVEAESHTPMRTPLASVMPPGWVAIPSIQMDSGYGNSSRPRLAMGHCGESEVTRTLS